ncbi:MAG: stage II sporulation protein D [Bacilli bacterium]
MKIKKIVLLTFSLLFIPYLIVSLIIIKQSPINFKLVTNNELSIRIKREKTAKIEKIPFEQYIVGVLSSEMPVSFELEALKAQAVAARSYALKKIENSKNDAYDVVDTVSNQVYLNNEELKAKWKNEYDEKMKKITIAVNETANEYLEYNGEVVQAFFFSTSVGKTENSEEVFQTALPYLRSVDSKWDKDASPVFNETHEFSLTDFYTKLNIPYNDTLSVLVIKTTSTGRIKKLKINNIEFTGNDIYTLFKLRSTFFQIKQVAKNVLITTTGFGHGVGMSQYGANGLAKEGYKYDQILKHYYTGTKIKKIN